MSSSATSKRPAIFVDRDGTLNREVEGALSRIEQVELAPRAGRALAGLSKAGFAIVVITNQSAIARGDLDHERLARVHEFMRSELARDGAVIDRFEVCPHHESEGRAPYRRACPCRKPKPGMLLDAAEHSKLDLASSWIVGDAERDLAAGRAVGVRGILVASGKGRSEFARLQRSGAPPEFFVEDLAAAAATILARR